jgi:hypothetical protein
MTAVRVGKLMREASVAGEFDLISGEVALVSQPWLAPAITVDQLTDAAAQLAEAAQTLDPDSLGHEAHVFRDLLDLDGAALRAEERRQKRSLRLFVQPDGTTKLVWVMDTETAAVVRNLYDRATSPKLQGPRFVNAEEQDHSDAILDGERTTGQLASDAFEQLLKLGADADPNFLLGSGAPIIKLTATADSVQLGEGLVRVEGQAAPLTVPDLERLRCGGTTGHVIIGPDGYALNFGREQRLFSRQQKESLAITWGGCALNGCDRPPSWTEAHHIVQWKRDGGKTDLRDGILLCIHHHLLSHNLKWEIFRDADGRYWLSKPGPDGSVITELRKNGLALRDLQRQQTAENHASP